MTDKKIELSQFYVKKEELRDHNSSQDSHPDLRTAASKSSIVNTIYPVGSIYMSVNNTNPSTLFGGTWVKIEGKFLLSSGKAPEDNSKTYSVQSTGGSKNAVTVEHTHIQNAHTHSQNSHNHTQNGHHHTTSGSDLSGNYQFLMGGHDFKFRIADVARKVPAKDSTGVFYFYATGDDLNAYRSTNTGNATATNNAATATNNNTTAVNQSTGVSGVDKNMPPYFVVNVWQRVA